jgi:hypothetical protein
MEQPFPSRHWSYWSIPMRYEIVRPVPDGERFWFVIDTKSPVSPNFQLASWSIHCPEAEKQAVDLCRMLNTFYG